MRPVACFLGIKFWYVIGARLAQMLKADSEQTTKDFTAMTKSRLHRIQQLCCLGLEQQPFILALLHELHEVIPSYANSFHWVDEQCQVTNVYDESPESMKLLPVYLHEYLNKGEQDAVPPTSELVARTRGLVTTAKVARPGYKNTIFYNEFLRPTRHIQAAGTVVEQTGVPLGLLLLHRDNETEFSPDEQRFLQELAPYIAHGLTATRKPSHILVDSEDMGLLILDEANRIRYASPKAQHLLVLCQHNVISPQSIQPGRMTVPPEAASLARRLRVVFQAPARTQPPPVMSKKNHWGEFMFRAHWLDDSTGGIPDDGLIGITIHYREPFSVRLFRKSRRLGLSPKQIRIGCLLADGLSYEEMAGELGVSQHTVIDHVRKLSDKLNARNRSELLTRLLSS